MSNDNKTPKRKLSIFSELSALSAVVLGLLIIGALLSLAVYIWMAVLPSKVYKIADHADLYSEEEEDELLSVMKSISREKDINVIVVTTTDKGKDYGTRSESESVRYAQDYFKKLAKFETFKDNSGVLILIELDGEYRFFYIVTFGTAKASITNSECDAIYKRQLSTLQSGDDTLAVHNLLKEVQDHNFTSGLLIFTYAPFIIGLLLIVAVVLWIMARKKRTKITVNYKTYYDAKNSEIIGDEDIFKDQIVSETYSSGSNEGFPGSLGVNGIGGGTIHRRF